jgi:uncharacterized OsmC-like protein
MTTSPPSTYVVTARSAGGDAEVTAGTSAVGLDIRWGEPPSGLPGPADLFASAFAACLLKNLERSRSMLSFSYEWAEVRVAARRQDAPPRFVGVSYRLTVATDESERRLELVHRNLRKFGTVYNTVAAVCDVHGEVVAATTAQDG